MNSHTPTIGEVVRRSKARAKTIELPSILRRSQLEQKIGLSRSAIYSRMDPASLSYDASFPKPFALGTGKNPPVGWLSTEVDAWIASLIRCTKAQ
jgi:prophage regulatory protein